MHEMWTIAIDDTGVCQSVCVLWAVCAKKAEWIDVLFWSGDSWGPRNTALDGSPHLPTLSPADLFLEYIIQSMVHIRTM